MTEIDPQKLLNVAMGIEAMDDVLTEEQQIEKAKEHWLTLPGERKAKILHRRKLREAMFKILKYDARKLEHMMTTELIALKQIIDSQLDPNLGMNWKGFTFVWDIHPHGTAKIVRKEAWVREGGQFDPEIGVHSPAAFTEQEID
jgi:hypothetical protein